MDSLVIMVVQVAAVLFSLSARHGLIFDDKLKRLYASTRGEGAAPGLRRRGAGG